MEMFSVSSFHKNIDLWGEKKKKNSWEIVEHDYNYL